MTQVDLVGLAAGLPEAWSSVVLGAVGGAALKVLRMDGQPLPPECHPSAEALLVIDGRLELRFGTEDLTLGPGELRLIPPGLVHAVRPGSHGTLVIVEQKESGLGEHR